MRIAKDRFSKSEVPRGVERENAVARFVESAESHQSCCARKKRIGSADGVSGMIRNELVIVSGLLQAAPLAKAARAIPR